MAHDGTPTHQVINLAGIHWLDRGRRAAFEAARPGYGVLEVATGALLSRDGVQPSCWRVKEAAHTHAEYPEASPHRVTPVR